MRRGEGKLFQRSKGGRWGFWLDGQRVLTPYTDRAAANEWRARHLRGSVAPSQCTVGQLLDLVEADYERKASRGSMLSRMRLLRPAFGKLRAVDVREHHIEAYRESRRRAGKAPGTINRELELLRRAFSLGKRATPPLVDHAPYVRMDREQNVRTQRISYEEYRELLAVLPEAERLATIIAYHVGWRKERVLSLRWEQVDWEGMVLRAPSGQERLKRVGTAPIYGDMQEALREALSGSSQWVVHRENGERVRSMDKVWRRAVGMVGLPGFRFHDLRACAVSSLIDYGISPYDVMQITGHKTESMLRRYDIVSTKRLQEIGRIAEEKRAQATARQP